ncbi:N-acetylglucosamine-6-phosphate deacetylase [Piscibacillus halophilus]|uniref:N-acetylglucosamine-6-phosphate deacetylase n=1 Tax=Piscibacillus halophilus TaxID=571933 RepID=A0A1H9I0K2_9BACI|nr:N-acetylglucosamine-6-phosphate deacetylase [Piscibacillus halophilus]SEQ68140.1 N-acetylglucosamine 6-phosphate deacetylase [Piscibacillus halophilus]
MKTLFKNVNVYTEYHVLRNSSLLIEKGIIKRIGHQHTSDGEVVDGEGLNLIPGFIDGHIHGAGGADVMDGTPEAIKQIAQTVLEEGVTSFVPTTITSEHQEIERVLDIVGELNLKQGAEVLGLHIEGPFVEIKKAGAQPKEYIVKPNVNMMKRWVGKSKGMIKTVTMAPELDMDGELIQYLVDKGIIASAGHTDAGSREIKLAVERGVRQMTHLCNAMNGIHHRDVGAVGAAMLLPDLKSEIIADRIHVTDDMLRLIYQTIGPDRILLITDAMRAKGQPDGTYKLGGQDVTVKQGKATLSDGTLAGSLLTMDQAARNMVKVTGASFRDIIQMASVNPAKQLGVFNRKGSIEVGKDADLLLVDSNFHIQKTICRGVVYD